MRTGGRKARGHPRGVSMATVSDVVWGRANIIAAMADRVREAARGLGYVADRFASPSLGGRIRVVAVLFPNLTDPFFAAILVGLERLVHADAFDIIVASSNPDDGVERAQRELGRRGQSRRFGLRRRLPARPGAPGHPHRHLDVPTRACPQAVRGRHGGGAESGCVRRVGKACCGRRSRRGHG